jgi:hypothetical protein
MSIVFDRDRWPLLVIRWNGTFTNAEFAEAIVVLERFLGGNEVFGVVNDLSALSTIPDAKQRKRLAEHLRLYEKAYTRRIAGWANVITSPIIRGVVTALSWWNPLNHPHVNMGTATEAEAWVLERLGAR